MRRLVFLDAAADDLEGILRYVARRSGSREVGARFVGELLARCSKLAALPGTLGRERPELRADLRSVPHKEYVIFFRYAGPVLEVVNVLRAQTDLEAKFRDGGAQDE